MRGDVAVRTNTHSGPDGQELQRFECTRRVELGNAVVDFDLSNIPNLSTLRRIDLAGNRFAEIDLSPLSKSKHLEYLCISDNILQRIDLSPLETCSELKVLDLSYNQLQDLDLHPLRKMRGLENLFIHFNHIQEVNVTPLLGCHSLALLDLEGWNHWPKIYLGLLPGSSSRHDARILIDILRYKAYPEWLSKHEKLIHSNIKATKTLIAKYGWSQLKRWLEEISEILPEDADFLFQRAFFESIEMEELACYDGDFIDIIDLIPSSKTYDIGKNEFYLRMVELLKSQLERGGSSLFFDIDQLGRTDAVVLLPYILQRRRQEVKTLRLVKEGDLVDLRDLWLTGYGYGMLKAMKVGQKVNILQFDKIKKAFSEIGITLKIRQGRENPEINVPEKFQKYILSYAK